MLKRLLFGAKADQMTPAKSLMATPEDQIIVSDVEEDEDDEDAVIHVATSSAAPVDEETISELGVDLPIDHLGTSIASSVHTAATTDS